MNQDVFEERINKSHIINTPIKIQLFYANLNVSKEITYK